MPLEEVTCEWTWCHNMSPVVPSPTIFLRAPLMQQTLEVNENMLPSAPVAESTPHNLHICTDVPIATAPPLSPHPHDEDHLDPVEYISRWNPTGGQEGTTSALDTMDMDIP